MTRVALVVVACLAGAACLTAPPVVVRDRRTALEEQALGSYRPLENDLRQASLSPKGVDLTRQQIVEAGVDTSQETIDVVVRIYGSVRADRERIDDLLRRHCVGEAQNGLLVETAETCAGEAEPSEVAELVQRNGRDRRQLWRYVVSQRTGASEAEVRKAWRTRHLQAVVCGGWVQDEDGSWRAKEC